MKHYEYEINLFIDGELEIEKQNELFSHLAGCAECQKLLADSLALKERTRIFCSENLSEIKNKPKAVNSFYKYGFYASAVAAVLLVFLLATAKPKEVLVTQNEVSVDTVFVEKEIKKENLKTFAAGREKKSNISHTVALVSEMKKMKSAKITFSDLIKYDVGS